MATVRLTQAAWQAQQLERLKSVLGAKLTRSGTEAQEVLRELGEMGFGYTPAEWQALAQALVTQGLIELVP